MKISLDYSTRDRRLRLARTVVYTLIFMTLLWCWLERRHFRTSADIRIDTGDIRIRYLGLPIEYQRMPEPGRSQLLAIAAKSRVLTSSWYTLAPFPDEHGVISICRLKYYNGTVWAAQDPELARLMLEDVALNITKSIPYHNFLLGDHMHWDNTGQWAVDDDWRQAPDILSYAASKGYSIPASK